MSDMPSGMRYATVPPLLRLYRGGWRGAALWTDQALPGLALFALLLGVPMALALGWCDEAFVSKLGRFCCFAIMAIGLDLVWGYTGILSLCQAMFFTIGGYAVGMYIAMQGPLLGNGIPEALYVVSSEIGGMTLPAFWQPFGHLGFALLMVVLLPGLLAFIFGYFAFRSRIRGVYFSIITQALTIAMWLLFCRNDLQLCGTNGITPLKTFAGFDLTDPVVKIALYEVSALALVGTVLLALWLTGTRFGRLLLAVRDSEMRLRFAGYQPVWIKTAVFTLGAVLAGIAGALYTPQNGNINPADMIAVKSILVVVWVAVGGRSTVFGAVLGALGINLLYSYLTSVMPSTWPFVLGGIFVGVVLFMPTGVIGMWRRLIAKAQTVKAVP